MKLYRTCFYLGVLLVFLSLFLISCRAILASHSLFTISHASAHLTDYTSCDGGLRGKIYFPQENIEVADVTLSVEEEEFFESISNFDDRGRPIIYRNMQVQIEAWCYGSDEQEIGYAKALGRIDYYGNLQYQASIALPTWDCTYEMETSSNPSLLEARGEAPCVFFSW